MALKGNVLDGHSFIDEVIEKGATTIIYEKDVPEFKNGVTYIKVLDTHSAVGIIAGNFYNNPSRKLKLVGITGTSGKTTTATLLHQLFRNLGYKVGMIGTDVNKINDKVEEAHRTTPDAVTLNKLLAEMADEGCEYCFMEVSSHSVSEKRISGISFVGGIFTNLSLDHLDYHKTLDEYCDAKKGFFDIIPATGFAIANIDDERGGYVLSTTKAHTYTLSLKKQADFNEKLETKLIGEFNLYNVLGVYAIAILLGQDRDKIREVIKTLDTVPGRFQYFKSENGVIGVVDYAHKPDALMKVLQTINNMKGDSRVIAVVGCGGDRDTSKRPIMAGIACKLSDYTVFTSDNPRSENPDKIIELSVHDRYTLAQIEMFPDLVVVLDAFRNNVQYSLPQVHIGAQKRDKFLAVVRMDPNTILNLIKPGLLQQMPEPVALRPPPFPDIKYHDTPPAVPPPGFPDFDTFRRI